MANLVLDKERFNTEFDQFCRFMLNEKIGGLPVSNPDPYSLALQVDQPDVLKPYDLVLMALVHGDEGAGLVVLNQILDRIENGTIQPKLNIAFVLGNVDAAFVHRRYIDRDMNRSFGFSGKQFNEQNRLIEIEEIIKNSHFLLDIHQTIEPSDTPFFVFKFSDRAARMANGIDSKFPIVTHKNTVFSSVEGMSSDEFAFANDCIGVSLEIGQIGYQQTIVETGISACVNAISYVENTINHRPNPANQQNAMYSWKHIEPYPNGYVHLKPGLTNFETVRAGQELGKTAENGPVVSPVDGWLLFPKYITPPKEKPAEIFRILQQVDYWNT